MKSISLKTLSTAFRRKPVVVELEPLDSMPTDPEAVAALASHPGFLHLLRKLRLQKRFFEQKLTSEVRTDIREVDQLQEAVRWSGWLEKQLNAAVGVQEKKRTQRKPTAEEQDAFAAAMAAIEEIGR